MGGHEERLADLGIILPPPLAAGENFVPVRICDGMAYVSGHGAALDDHALCLGVVPDQVDVERARWAARQTAMALLSTLHDCLGSLDAIDYLVSIRGYIATAQGFTQHPTILDGASELFLQIFGPHGVHARCAIGVASLPFGLTVEIELTARLA
ncbi:RidA family protein [Streptomyces cyaneofuscatus]|uniref:RidA family protein n=1 Tax=Streptomyces cyaneofuscatus TaxID=66883 RepID=UPI003650371F